MTKRVAHILMVAAVWAMLGACGDTEFRYSNYHCNLTLDNAIHQDATLASAMDSNAPGTFCAIGCKMEGGAKYFTFRNSHGASTQSIFKAIDDRLESQLHLGLNGTVIVGYGNMDYPAPFYAYDGECPNCFRPDALPVRSYPLSMSAAGIATCGTCKRQYNLNLEGMVVSGGGKPLTLYRASTTGPTGKLQVY